MSILLTQRLLLVSLPVRLSVCLSACSSKICTYLPIRAAMPMQAVQPQYACSTL